MTGFALGNICSSITDLPILNAKADMTVKTWNSHKYNFAAPGKSCSVYKIHCLEG